MKPGKYDRKHPFPIAGAELRELKRHAEETSHLTILRFGQPPAAIWTPRPIVLYGGIWNISWTFCRWRWMTETSILLHRARPCIIGSNKNRTLPTGKVSAV